MISLQIQAETPALLHQTLRDLLNATAPHPAIPQVPVHVEAEVLAPEGAKAPGKRGPKAKQPEAAIDVAPAADAPKPPTYDDLVNACKKVVSTEGKGMPGLRDLLGKFNDAAGKPVQQTKAVKVEDYAAVIAAAEAAAA